MHSIVTLAMAVHLNPRHAVLFLFAHHIPATFVQLVYALLIARSHDFVPPTSSLYSFDASIEF